MKTQTVTKKYSMLLFSALASLMLMTAACQKNNSGGNNNPAPVGPIYPGCTVQPCAGGPGQVPLYGGTTNGMNGVQAQFQVTGDQSGNGMASITGQVNFTGNYVCQVGMPNLMGPYMIQMTQQAYLQSDVFDGMVMLQGQGTIAARINIVPVRTQNTGLFTLVLSQCRDLYGMPPVIQMNF